MTAKELSALTVNGLAPSGLPGRVARVMEARVRTAGELTDHLAGQGPILVALSGGVDSTVAAELSWRALGREGSLAVTLTGPATSQEELRAAEQAARVIGIRHRAVRVDPLAEPGYASNPTNRCFFCRTVEASALTRLAAEEGYRTIIDGLHLDDLGEERPGIRAMDRAGVQHPLVWARWRKADVRQYARSRELPNADRPSEACLASRIAHGLPISLDGLARIEAAETAVRHLGFRRVRVRTDRERSARVEVDPSEVDRLLEAEVAHRVRDALGRLGFDPVELDPRGYRPRASA